MPELPRAIVDDLFRKAAAGRWGLSHDEFADAVAASLRHAFAGGEPSRGELDRYLTGLHIADLALAAACALGRDSAWDHFVLQHRPALYRAADSLDPTGAARELADSLYADLYGLKGTDTDRRSLFRYFHGRSSLSTWLRAVLGQRHVDGLRARRRLEPLPDDQDAVAEVTPREVDPDRALLIPLVERALHAAIAELSARDRLRLRSYYVAELTLLEISRITGEHESTVSRQLSRTRRTLREAIQRRLREARLSEEQITRAFELVMEDPGGVDLGQRDQE